MNYLQFLKALHRNVCSVRTVLLHGTVQYIDFAQCLGDPDRGTDWPRSPNKVDSDAGAGSTLYVIVLEGPSSGLDWPRVLLYAGVECTL